MLGLSCVHHGELNSLNVSAERIAELRLLYANDPVALQQIDVYDGSTEYHEQFGYYRDALKAHNAKREAEAYAWLKKHYPDV